MSDTDRPEDEQPSPQPEMPPLPEEAPELAVVSGGPPIGEVTDDVEEPTPEPRTDLPYEYVHVACGGVAFLLDAAPVPGQPVASIGLYRVDGTPIRKGGLIQCAHCGTSFAPRALAARHVRERRV